MTDTDKTTVDRDALPFVAPCRDLKPWAPFQWLMLGAKDLFRAPRPSLFYGLIVAILMAAVALLAYMQDVRWIMFAMIGGFTFLAPLTCVGLYAISAQLERDQPPSLARSLHAAFRRHLGNEMIFAIALLVIFLVWARAAVMVGVFFPTEGEPTPGEYARYLGIGSVVGSIFAAVTFSASAFSLPMIMHRDVDSVTAIVTSINAVLRNKYTMFVWLALIVSMLIIGFVTFGIGLIVIIPLIGYAAWHGYLETIDADAFPRHEVGITATPRGQ
ncbi:MAG: DUF2189 domain-containing protein [Woeseiaceae bacterium]|nr:DUF2189 domain-containing protein [Woeseiaceae bacterium]